MMSQKNSIKSGQDNQIGYIKTSINIWKKNTNKEQESYTSEEAYALANIIKHYTMIKGHNKGNSYAQTYSLSNGLK